MGIYGALVTAITGLRAQSFALDQISGNIANSQTTAFKRTETRFVDLIPDAPPSLQKAGGVTAFSKATNDVQGDIRRVDSATAMAVNGEGYFIVERSSGYVDNKPIFTGSNAYTRRGDFEIDRDGYLVNGAGYFLKGLTVDSRTGNVAGSIPQVIRITNDLLPAKQTTEITYKANLPAYPLTSSAKPAIPGSELLTPTLINATTGTGSVAVNTDATAKVTGSVSNVTNSADFNTQFGLGGTTRTLSVTVNGTPSNLTIGTGNINTGADLMAALGNIAGISVSSGANNQLIITAADPDTSLTIGGTAAAPLGVDGAPLPAQRNLLTQFPALNGKTLTIAIGSADPTTITFGNAAGQVSTLSELEAKVAGAGAVLTRDGSEFLTITTNTTNAGRALTVGGSGASTLGLPNTTTTFAAGRPADIYNVDPRSTTGTPAGTGEVIANDVTTFTDHSIAGGALTAYDSGGNPINLQLRWAKVDSSAVGEAEVWNLFYQTNSNATGTQVAWRNANINYTFNSSGQLTNPAGGSITLTNLTVNGVGIPSVLINHGQGAMTQFADPNGATKLTELKQNGYAAGEPTGIQVTERGRVRVSYSNGEAVDLAEIPLVGFNADNQLKKLDGGAFEETQESGAAIIGASGTILGGSVEGSNTDIADEFTKLIVTQQAYSANTRVVTISQDMMKDALNMLR